jgi:roadblock/LC7 domain-containing protein
MKFTHIAPSGRLEFNDLGKVIKGVSPQDRFVALDPTESVYLPDGQDVMYSAQTGDAKKYKGAGLIAINDTVNIAAAASVTLTHGFGFLPKVTIARLSAGVWEDVSFVASNLVTVKTNAAMTETIITNVSVAALDLHIRIS